MAILLQKNAAGPPERAGASAMGLILILLGGLHYGYNIGIVGASLGRDQRRVSADGARAAQPALAGDARRRDRRLAALGLCADRFGRRLCTIIGESLSVLGSLGCLVGETLSALVACRLVVGVGVGFCTLAADLRRRDRADALRERRARQLPRRRHARHLAAHSIPAAVPWRSRFGAARAARRASSSPSA